MNINEYIDHTQIKPFATEKDIEKLLEEAKQHHFFSACVALCWVAKAKKFSEDTSVKICTIAGFPLGSSTAEAKAFEAKNAFNLGADEIDMVINVGFLRSKRFDDVLFDIESVVKAAPQKIIKVILETGYLTEEEIIKGCELSYRAGAHFVKTSTGFGKGQACVEHVRLMNQTIGNKLKIKASAGIRDRKSALDMIQAGADRIGTSSGIQIMEEERLCNPPVLGSSK